MQRDKVKNIASFGQKNFIKGGGTLSISDGRSNGRISVALRHDMHKRFPDVIRILPPECRKEEECDYFFPEGQLFLANRGNYSFAIKGGDNNEPYNHNDADIFEGELIQIVERLITGDRPEICGDAVLVDNIRILIPAHTSDVRISEHKIEVTNNVRANEGSHRTFYSIDFIVPKGNKEMTLAFVARAFRT